MKVSLAWLREFVDLPTEDLDELTYAFDMLGHTVEDVEVLEPEWTEVYVGKVLDVAAHPDADRVRVCQVDHGQGPSQIICGAWNFESGATVAVARPGSVLAGGLEIGQRTIRGVESNGMICSERELGIGSDQTGILVLEDDLEVGRPFHDVVELPDVVFELEITTNRPDALSLVGVARDLGAWFDVETQIPPLSLNTVPGDTPVSVEIEDPTGCRRFTAREIRGVRVGPSPLRVRHRLHKVGVRSISNVVDVTNYVMFELGHPLHAFDADTIAGDRLVVKRATPGETLETLDHVERTLSGSDLIIYDQAGATSMSGTMGGARSEVSTGTTRVLMEAASWDPPTIMDMWRRHDLRSEAATRFERGVDPNLADIANQRACAMVEQLAGGEVLEGAVDVVAVDTRPWTVDLSLDDVTRLLGEGFDPSGVRSILERLDLVVEGEAPFTVTIPTFRPDLTRPADLVEEVARIHGFDKFGATLPTGPAGGLTPEQRRLRRALTTLTGLGLSQAINLPFVSVEDLTVLGMETDGSALLTVRNPLREEEGKLRSTLLPGLLNDLRYNRSHGRTSVALFEFGRVFSAQPDRDDPRLPTEFDRISWAVIGEVGIETLGGGASVTADATVSLAILRHLAAALDLEVEITPATRPGFHPGRTAEVSLGGVALGHVGELSPMTARHFELEGRVAVAEIDLDPLLAPVGPTIASAPSVFPHVDFDLSFLVPAETTAGALLDATTRSTDLVESARVFDEFTGDSIGEGMRALAFRYRLRASDRTLEQREIGEIRDGMIEAAGRLGARLRGA